jgi:hypothetical protein
VLFEELEPEVMDAAVALHHEAVRGARFRVSDGGHVTQLVCGLCVWCVGVCFGGLILLFARTVYAARDSCVRGGGVFIASRCVVKSRCAPARDASRWCSMTCSNLLLEAR